MRDIVIIGGRGNGTVIASTIEDCQRAGASMRCIGFLNDFEQSVGQYPVLGKVSTEGWQEAPKNSEFVYALSTVKQARERYDLLQQLEIPADRFASIIHPSAIVAQSARLQDGVVVMPLCVVGPDVVIGAHTQLYAQSFIGHDSGLGEMVFVANNATIGGRVLVGTGAHIGSNSSVREHVSIGRYAIVGLGAAVITDVREATTVVGNPAEPIK